MSPVWRAGLVVAAALFCSAACQRDPAERRPAQAQDTSCHNPRSLFVNGATRISAILQIDLKATNDEWAELTELLQAFADSHGLSFRDGSRTQPGVLKSLYLSLCGPNQPNIEIAEQRWATNHYAAPIGGRGIGIPFYGNLTEAAWHPVAVELVATLKARWPDGVRFLNGDGYWIDPPEFLGEPAAPAQQASH